MQQQSGSGMQVELKFFPLAFLFHFCTPVVAVNGQSYRRPWGFHFFELPPGAYHVRIWVPYMFWPECGANELQVNIRAGEVVAVTFNMPPWVFARGSLYQQLLPYEAVSAQLATDYGTSKGNDTAAGFYGRPPTSALAVTSMILGIISPLFLCLCLPSFVASLAAVVTGHIALVRINRSRGALGGRGFAIAGLAMGYPFLILTAVFLPSFVSGVMEGINEAQ